MSTIILDEHIIIEYGKRQLGMRVTPDMKILVKVPLHWSKEQVHSYLQKYQPWIQKQETRIQESKAFTREGKVGETYPYLGKDYSLHFQEAPHKKLRIQISGNTLICTGQDFQAPKVIKAIQAWYKQRATEIIEDRVHHYSSIYGFKPKQIRIKSIKTRWGSCSSLGNLNFAWTLICFDLKVIDYVVVHELCHLKQMNHSPQFWRLVQGIVPDYKAQKRILRIKQHQIPLFIPPRKPH